MKKFRGLCFIIAAVISSGFAQTSVERIAVRLQELNVTLDELAKSTILQAHDGYFTNELFISMIRQNPAVSVITKIGPDGRTVNVVTGKGVVSSAKNVGGARWFLALTASRQPYTGISRDAQGNVYLFRAWPLLENTASANRFVGVLTAKIDVKSYLAGVQKNAAEPVQVLFNGTPLYSRNWNTAQGYGERVLKLSEIDQLVIRYNTSGGLAADAAPQPAGRQPAHTGEAAASSKIGSRMYTDTKTAARAPGLPVQEKREVAVPRASMPVLDRTDLSDSLLAASIRPSPGLQRAAVVMVLAGMALVMCLVVGVLVFRRLRRSRRRSKTHADTLQLEPIDAIMIEDEDEGRKAEDTKTLPRSSLEEAEILSEISSVERETKELPAIKELIAESSKKLAEYEAAANPVMRSQLLRDIHENLSGWVSGELGVLAGQLGQLSESIRTCEKSDGHTAELQMLRYEIGRILEEIRGIDQRIAREILIK